MSLESINEALTDITGVDKPIAQNLECLIDDIRGSYSAIAAKGGVMPANRNTNNLPSSIEQLIEEEQ